VLWRETVNTYYNPTISNLDPNYRLKGLIKSTEIRDGGGTAASRTEFFYDDPNTTGNLTETRSWSSTKGGYSNPLSSGNSISSFVQYDQYGNATKTTDARGTETLITYGNVTGPNGAVSGLFPTQTVAAYGTSRRR
jgi:hypothetical protein